MNILPQNKKVIFVPSHYGKKHILKKSFSSQKRNIVASLRKVEDFDETPKVYTSYEIEFQPQDASQWQDQELLQLICEHYDISKLPTNYFSEERFDADTNNLELTRKVNDLLGFK